MRHLQLATFIALASVTIIQPVQAQIQPQSSPAPETSEGAQTQGEDLQGSSLEPLQVTEQQRDQFFTPAPPPPPIQAEPGARSNTDRLIQPPPGSQTPGQMTPGRRLSFPLN